MLKLLFKKIEKKAWSLGWNYLLWFLIGIILLIIILAGVFILSGRGDNYISFIKDILRFG